MDNNMYLISPVKRAKFKKLEQQKRKYEMRAALPVLTREEIRRYRLPRYKALLAELQEQGYYSSKEYLEQLLQYQATLREFEGPNSIVWLYPELINENKHLERIYNTLKIAEDAHYNNNIAKELDELITLAVYYAFGNKVWWWLGEQILIQCVHISNDYNDDGYKRKALTRFFYGNFLVMNKKENKEAEPHLIQARTLSKSMTWNSKYFFKSNEKTDTLFNESCKLLYQIYMSEAASYHLSQPKKAVDICELARKHAAYACDNEREANALMFQGICYLEASDPRNATIVFTKSLLLNKKLQRHEEICKARINLALAYIKVDNFEEAIKHLEELQNYAEKMNLPYYIGQTYRYLGEYYINEGQPHLALPILEQAVLIFHSLNAAYERLQANNFSAIARGQILLRNYAHLVIRSGYEGKRNLLMKLIDWKDSRIQFWKDDEDDEADSIASILSVYQVDEDNDKQLRKGVSRVCLSSIILSSTHFGDSSSGSSSSTKSASLESIRSTSTKSSNLDSNSSRSSKNIDETESKKFLKMISMVKFKLDKRVSTEEEVLEEEYPTETKLHEKYMSENMHEEEEKSYSEEISNISDEIEEMTQVADVTPNYISEEEDLKNVVT